MFNKKNYKKVLISVLALMMIFGTVALAAEGIFDKKITATYGRIKFTYKGNDVTKIIENQYGTPSFTVDGRAYAPVRAMADLLGVEIDYDSNTHTVKITTTELPFLYLSFAYLPITLLTTSLNSSTLNTYNNILI